MGTTTGLRRLGRIFDNLRDVRNELSLQQLQCFVAVALNEGILVRELGDKLGISGASASRNVDILSSFGRGGVKGMELIERRDDPDDRRRRALFLTDEGRALAAKLNRALG